jgi:F0F1-type ATP synthase membrane subunit b/b'
METAPTFYEQLAQWSEIVGGFAFVVVAIVLFQKYVLPAVRSGQIAKNADLVNAEERREKLTAEIVKARAEVEAADRDARAIKERAATDGVRERQRFIDEARADGERVVANAGNELGRARVAAQAQLRADFLSRALELARSSAASRIDAGVNARLVSSTVQTLLSGDGVESAA